MLQIKLFQLIVVAAVAAVIAHAQGTAPGTTTSPRTTPAANNNGSNMNANMNDSSCQPIKSFLMQVNTSLNNPTALGQLAIKLKVNSSLVQYGVIRVLAAFYTSNGIPYDVVNDLIYGQCSNQFNSIITNLLASFGLIMPDSGSSNSNGMSSTPPNNKDNKDNKNNGACNYNNKFNVSWVNGTLQFKFAKGASPASVNISMVNVTWELVYNPLRHSAWMQ
jgi:hypothetical protein